MAGITLFDAVWMAILKVVLVLGAGALALLIAITLFIRLKQRQAYKDMGQIEEFERVESYGLAASAGETSAEVIQIKKKGQKQTAR